MNFVRRFSRTERTLHWVNATGFLLLLATGLILYLPRLSVLVGRRPLIKDIHFWGGVGWVSALALVALSEYTQVPTWFTVNAWPPMTSMPVLVGPLFAATE